MTDTHEDEESSDLDHDPAYHALFPDDDLPECCESCGGNDLSRVLIDYEDGEGYICGACREAILAEQNVSIEPESEQDPIPPSSDPEPEPASDYDEPSNHDAKRQRLG